jgi:hypothetical protein
MTAETHARIRSPIAGPLDLGRPALFSCGALIRSHPWIFTALTITAFLPLATTAIFVGRHGGVLTGTDGGDYFDQFQYLAWIRDEGAHLLSSNLWVIGRTPHDYLQPMYLISGFLWRAGLSIQAAYLVWKPVALLVLFLGFAAYVHHTLPVDRRKQSAALWLALFYATPVYALARWTGHLTAAHQYQLVLATDDLDSMLNLWGFAHTAIAIGLMPVFLVASEKLLRAEAHGRRLWSFVAALSGMLVSWLHPWQGLILVAVIGGMLVIRAPRRRYLRLALPVVITVAPLLYGLILAHFDRWWHTFQVESTVTGTAPWWALLASLGPLGAAAALGVRRPRSDAECMLLLWVGACAAVYFLVPEYPPHALCGLTLPLAILAVHGWKRVQSALPARGTVATICACVAALTVSAPALAYHIGNVGDNVSNTAAGSVARRMFRLTADQAATLSYLDKDRRTGGVLAPWLLSLSIPAFTGREVFAGHLQWEPSAVLGADLLFFGAHAAPSGAVRRAILARSRARFVIADCGASANLGAGLAPVARPIKRFGCVTLYQAR